MGGDYDEDDFDDDNGDDDDDDEDDNDDNDDADGWGEALDGDVRLAAVERGKAPLVVWRIV